MPTTKKVTVNFPIDEKRDLVALVLKRNTTISALLRALVREACGKELGFGLRNLNREE